MWQYYSDVLINLTVIHLCYLIVQGTLRTLFFDWTLRKVNKNMYVPIETTKEFPQSSQK